MILFINNINTWNLSTDTTNFLPPALLFYWRNVCEYVVGSLWISNKVFWGTKSVRFIYSISLFSIVNIGPWLIINFETIMKSLFDKCELETEDPQNHPPHFWYISGCPALILRPLVKNYYFQSITTNQALIFSFLCPLWEPIKMVCYYKPLWNLLFQCKTQHDPTLN